MLYYQMPMYFFLGAMLYTFPDVAQLLGIAYLGILLYRNSKH